MSVKVEFLSSIPYFSSLDLAEVESIKQFVFERTAEKDEFILNEGEPAEALYFVLSGVVKVVKISEEGKEQILRIVRPGESFNDVPIFDGGPTLAIVQAMSPALLYGISRTNMKIVLREHPKVAPNAIKVLAERVRYFVSLVEDLSFKHVIGRVAKLLLEHAGDKTEPGPKLTQQEMAAMVGTVREMVSRSLRELEERGIIRIDRHRIVILNKEALKGSSIVRQRS